jgi:hypothetical protein
METRAKIIVTTVLFSLVVAILSQKEELRIVSEIVIAAYFFVLILYNHFRSKTDVIYPYLAVVFLLLVSVFSFFKEDILAEQFAVFFFFTLISILIMVFLHQLRHEK